jgi:2-oxoglutarate ferredoxin oxidoreductase subunit beta
MSEAITTNKVGLGKNDYQGAKSTLCTGCGHDSISANLMTSFFQQNIHPHNVMKFSGIGCSSKTPAYWLNKSYGFNSMHGRMAPIATGAIVVQNQMLSIGVSGDGDSASIGMGGFIHLLRRNLPIVYLIANNGVYGLTKGQFSATVGQEMLQKSGRKNPYPALDLCGLALEAGCSFVARSFSGDSKQLVQILSAAFHHKGTALIDIISPCITFANHDGSTMSYMAVKNHNKHLQEIEFVIESQEKKVDYDEGTTQMVPFNDGSAIYLKKLDSKDHDVKDANKASEILRTARENGEILTGIFYLNESEKNFIDTLNLPNKPLSNLNEIELRPTEEQFKNIMAEFK